MDESNNQSSPISQDDYKQLSKKELNQRLDALLSTPSNEQKIDEAQFLLHELQVHQIELEIQNLELRETQALLEEARDRYADLYDFAPVGYLTLDHKGIIRNMNLVAASLLGSERAQLEGMPFVTKLAAGEQRVFYKQLKKLFESQARHAFELQLKQPDNHAMLVRIEGIPVKVLNGETDRCNCAIIDITEQKKAEEQLRLERDRAQLYLDTVENIIVVLDRNGNITLANRKACEVLGYQEGDLIGKNWFTTCLPVAEREDVSNVFAQLIAGKANYVEYFTNTVITRNGEKRIIDWHNKCLQELNGVIAGTLGCGEDVTEQKQLEQELHLLHKAVEQNPDSVMVTDLEGYIEYINSAFTRKTGYQMEEVLGKNPNILKSGKTPIDQYENLWETIISGKDWVGEILNKKKNGELFWEQVSISPIRNSKKEITHFLSIQEDITEKKRLKEHAQHHQAELAFMARLNTMGEMATGLAHELNQPLAAISTYADVAVRMLNSGIKQPNKFREAIEGSKVQAIRASEIIRHLRQLVRKQGSEKIEVDLNGLISDVIDFLGTEIQKQDVELHLQLQQGIPPLFVDNIQIEQVLINLIRNAYEVELPISCSKRDLTIRTAIIGNDQVQISVSDNGKGMDSETMSQIFNPFFSTKGDKGMGMGLSICRSIIEAHDGRMGVTSRPGEGSTFLFSLPITAHPLKHQ